MKSHITIPLTSAEAIEHHKCYLLQNRQEETAFQELTAGNKSIRFTNTEAAAERISNALRELATMGLTVTIHNPDGSSVSLKPV
jgi:hypothetical protein